MLLIRKTTYNGRGWPARHGSVVAGVTSAVLSGVISMRPGEAGAPGH